MHQNCTSYMHLTGGKKWGKIMPRKSNPKYRAEEKEIFDMALTRKFLSALGIEEEKADQIMQGHVETVDGLKAERDQYKADAEKLPGVQKELDDLKAAGDKDPWRVKYDALKEDFDNYKTQQTAKETKAAKQAAYRELLKDAGIAEKRIDAVLRVSDVDSVKLGKDGKIVDAENLTKSIKDEWADFIVSSELVGAKTPTPPVNNGGKVMTREDIYKRDERGQFMLDATQRQAALAQVIALEQQKG